MHVLVEKYASTAVLTIATPRFNQAVAPDILDEAAATISPDVTVYLINLGHVVHIDSAAIGVLVNLMKRIGRDRTLDLCAPAPTVRKVLRMTRMDTVFKIHATVAAGLEVHFTSCMNAG